MDESKQYVVIYDWMVYDLDLSKSTLLIYALIFGFTIGKKGKFYGTLKYICDRFHINKDTASIALNFLLKKQYNGGGIIRKEIEIINGKRYCYYIACLNRLPAEYIKEALKLDS